MFSDFFDLFKTRLSSPLLMSIFVSFVLINWQAFYYLIFSGAPTISSVDNWWIKSKFAYWHEYMNWCRYLLPIPIGLAYALFGPKISLWAAKLTSKDVSAKRMLEKDEASKVLEHETKLKDLRNAAIKAAIDEAENRTRIKNIPDDKIRKNLEANVDELEKMGDEIVTSNVKAKIVSNSDIPAELDAYYEVAIAAAKNGSASVFSEALTKLIGFGEDYDPYGVLQQTKDTMIKIKTLNIGIRKLSGAENRKHIDSIKELIQEAISELRIVYSSDKLRDKLIR